MSTSKGKNTGSRAVSRTWTDQQDVRNNKRLRVTTFSILLVVTVATFIYFVLDRTPTNSFVIACAFPDYGKRLPSPLYAEWDLKQVEELATKKSVSAWKNLQTNDSPALKLQSYDHFQKWLKELEPRLKNSKVASKDTLMVYIRAHAIVRGTSVVILAGEAPTKASGSSGDSEASEQGQIPIKEILKKLQDLPAQNVILLADICDITSSIELNLPKNPVTTRLQEICETLKQNAKNNVFVITSKADYQPTHISHLRKKTLLQSACEFALDLASDKVDQEGQGDGKISLTEFYERITRYCFTATSGVGAESGMPIDHRTLQIPLLMKVGDTQNLLPESVSWKAASEVLVARTVTPQKDSGKPDVANKRPDNGGVASNDSQPTAQKNDPTVVAATASDASKETEEIEPELLRYWKVRDELKRRQLRKWSPVEFAPLLWNLHQRQFLTDRLGKEAPRLLEELEQLAKLEQTGAGSSLPGFPSAYKSLKDSNPIVWEQPDVLPQKDQKKWKAVSEEYRKYVDACADLPNWILWTRGSLDQVELLKKLVGTLTSFQKNIGSNSALLDVQSYDASSIQSTMGSLQAALKEKIDLVKKTLSKNAKLGWKEEYRLEQVWMSPLLSYEERKELYQKAKVMTIDNIAEPNQDSLPLELSKTLDKIVVLPNVDPALGSWERTLEDSLRLVDAEPAQASSTGFSDKLRNLVADSNRLSEFQKWHLGCLLSLLSETPNETMIPLHGIVLPVSKSRSLALELADGLPPKFDQIAFGDQQKKEVVLSIKRRDGSDVHDCSLSWKFMDGPRNDGFLSISTDRELKPDGMPQQVRVNNKGITLTLSTKMDSTQVTSPVRIQFTATESKTGEKAEFTAFIHPRQPDQIELVVTQILGEQRKEITQGSLVRPYLPVLAIAGAQAKFEFAVKNFSSKPKRVTSKVYVVPLLSRKLESAAIRKLIEAISPSFEGGPLELPAAGTVASPKKLEIKVRPPGESKVNAKSSPTGKHPFECLVFEFTELDSDGKPQVNKTSYQFVDLVGQSPFSGEDQIVRITPKINDDSDPGAIALHFEASEDAWQKYGHSELSVDVAEVTNEDGAEIAAPGARSLKLTKEKSEAVLAFTTAQPDGTNVIVHLTVGGYPRAIAYRRDTQGTLDKYSGPFVWLGDIQALAKDHPMPIPAIDPTAEKLVFPAFKEIVGLLVQARVDRPPNDFDMGIQLFSGEDVLAASKPESDRNFDFTLKAEDGALDISAKASDLECLLTQEKDGFYKVVVHSANAVRSKELVIDHARPQPVTIKATNGTRLYKGEGEAIQFEIVPLDKESGIKEAFLYLKTNNTEFWEEKDIVLPGGQTPTGSWKFTLTPDLIPKALPNKVALKIVAKTIDVAGNTQLKHEPLSIDWVGKERPKTKQP